MSVIGSVCWVMSDPKSWEAYIFFFTTLTGQVAAQATVLRDHFVYGASHGVARTLTASDIKGNEECVARALVALVEKSPTLENDAERFLYGAYGILLRRLKIVEMKDDGRIRPVSERAELFIRMLVASAKANIGFAGEWKAKGTQNPPAEKLGNIIRSIEEFRILASGGFEKAAAIRNASSSLILIKAKRSSAPVFLMRWSDAWGGYFWFVGGIQDSNDSTAEICALRELREEIGLRDTAIQNLTRLTTVRDRRISSRQNVLTDYQYNLFSVAVDESCQSVGPITRAEFVVDKIVGGGHRVGQRCKWMTWQEIRSSQELVRDASEIILKLESYGVDRIPLSLRTEIS